MALRLSDGKDDLVVDTHTHIKSLIAGGVMAERRKACVGVHS